MSFFPWDKLHPEVLASIRRHKKRLDDPSVLTCGCMAEDERFGGMCSYHEGMEAGAKLVQPEVERLTLMHLSAESELMSAQAREVALRAIPDLLCGEEWEGAGVPVGGSVVVEVRRLMDGVV